MAQDKTKNADKKLRVAYIFQSSNSSMILNSMVLPQLEERRHGADVIGMFFMFDNTYLLQKNNPTAERIISISKKYHTVLMGCDQCCYQRNIADKLMPEVQIGCFPDLYKSLGQTTIDQIITL